MGAQILPIDKGAIVCDNIAESQFTSAKGERMEDRLYTTQEVAKELSVTDSYIRNLIVQGKAHPKQQIGGTWLFTLEEIERLRSTRRRRGRPKQT